MSVSAAKLTKHSVMALALEASTGVEESLAAGDGAMNVFNASMKFDDTGVDREGQGSLSSIRRQPGGHSGTVEFDFELGGTGSTTLPAQFDIWLASGFKATGASSNVLSPLTSTDVGATATVGRYQSGRFKSLAGVMFDLTLTGELGKAVRVKASGRGKRKIGATYGPRDVTLLAPTYPTILAPVLRSVTFTIGGTAFLIPGFELALGNQLDLREDITDETGYLAAQVVSHARRFRISPEALPLSTKDWYDVYESGTEAALVLTIGGTAGNSIAIAAPKLQLAMPPEDEDRGGKLVDKLEFQLNRSAAAGDDELTATYSLASP